MRKVVGAVLTKRHGNTKLIRLVVKTANGLAIQYLDLTQGPEYNSLEALLRHLDTIQGHDDCYHQYVEA